MAGDLPVLLKGDTAFVLEASLRPVLSNQNWCRQPVHVEGEVVKAAEENISTDRAGLQHADQMLRPRVDENEAADFIKRPLPHGAGPAKSGVVLFHLSHFVHDVLPGAGTERRIAVLKINAGESQIHRRLFTGFIERHEESLRFVTILRVEALEFAVGVIEGVVNALAPKEQTITSFHVSSSSVLEEQSQRLATTGLIVSASGVLLEQAQRLLAKPLANGLTILLNLCRSSGKKWSQWSGLNRRPTVYETVALPLSYIGSQTRLCR